MKKYFVTAPEDLPEMTLQTYVAHAFPLLSSRALRDAFAKKDVKMNGIRCSKQQIVIPGSEITVFTSEEISIPVVYEDSHILVLNKPAGVSTDVDRYHSMTMLEWACLYANGAYLPRMCHRLDNQTCGLIVLAKTDEAEEALKEMFAKRTGEKEYRCIVKGTPSPRNALLTAWLKKDPRESKVYISEYEKPGTKQIVTEYEVLKGGETALLRILLHTGRTHQIRAHMQHIGHPLLGDDAYGDRVFNKTHNARALSLCSVRLKIDTRGKLPEIDGIEVCIKAPFDI